MMLRAASARLAYAGLLAAGLALSACAPRPAATASAVALAETDDAHPGKAAYMAYCSSCHDNSEKSGAPAQEALRTLNRATITYALTLGYMKQQASHVPPAELKALIDWLPRSGAGDDGWVKTAECPIKLRRVRLDGAPRIATRFGVDLDNNRSMTAERAGLGKGDMANLELAWAIAFPQTPTMRSQPVIVGDTIFISATDSARIYALDTDTGCVKWMYPSDMTLRSSLAFADAGSGHPALLIAGDAAGRVHAINAETGAVAWISDIKLNELNRITGGPVVDGETVYVPLSAIEVNYTADDAYECCKGQGAVAALNLADGKEKWIGRTMEDSKPTRLGRTGTQQWGPSGAIIWSTPAIDGKRGLLYAGTGENTSWPATNTSDAIIAYDLKTGERRWVFQATSFDIWNYACGRRSANCDWPGEYHSPDFDFGGSAILVHRPGGGEMVVAGQKSGAVWAIDPDTGAQIWGNKIGRGGGNGGIHWGIAYDRASDRIFAPMNDPLPPGAQVDNPNWGAGVHALDAATGEIRWSYRPTMSDCGLEIPAGHTLVPAPEWRMTAVTAPLTPPPRPIASPTPRVQTVAASPAAASPTPSASPSAAPAASPTPASAQAARPANNRCRVGVSAAPLVVDGAVVTGNLAGMLRIFDGENGKVLFEYQTNRDFPKTTNGLPGHGGSLDSAPYIAGDGKLFVQSGYARFGELPGNVLLAFRPKR